MTSGERMVWAAEFVRCLALGTMDGITCVKNAAMAVLVARAAGHQFEDHESSAFIMLRDMLSNGGDR